MIFARGVLALSTRGDVQTWLSSQAATPENIAMAAAAITSLAADEQLKAVESLEAAVKALDANTARLMKLAIIIGVAAAIIGAVIGAALTKAFS